MCRMSTRGWSLLRVFGPFVVSLFLGSSMFFLPPSAVGSTQPAVQQVPATFYGLNAQALLRMPPTQWEAQLTKIATTGVSEVRFDTNWSSAEPNPPSEGVHTYNWTRLDQIMAALARHNLRGLPIVDYSAKWDSSDPTGAQNNTYPPSDPAMFADFARALAARYGLGGAFWASNPSLPALPVSRYEIWNEENSDYFFRGADPTVYAPLYADARAAIHEVDPSATVLVGGLVPTANPIGWLQGFIAALPDHGQEIDAIGWHPYYTTTGDVYASLRALHTELSANGLDPAIELTEINSPTSEGQAALLSELALTLPRSDCHVTSMTVHTWTALPEDQAAPYAIADSSGNLNASGVAFSSAVQVAEAQGVVAPPPICAPVAPPSAVISSSSQLGAPPQANHQRARPRISTRHLFRRGKTLRLRRRGRPQV